MTALILAAQLVTAPVCHSPQPGPTWVCVNGGWLPPGHPSIPEGTTPQPGPAPAPPNAPNPQGFQLGHTYKRAATGTRIYIMSIGQDVNGFLAFTAQCLDERTEDHCYGVGWPLLLYAHLNHIGWVDFGPYPDGHPL